MTPSSKINNLRRLFVFLSTFFLLLCGMTGCSTGSSLDSANPENVKKAFDAFLKEQFAASFEEDLIHLHYTLKHPETYGIEKPKKASSSLTADSLLAQKEGLLQMQELLSQFQEKHLSEEQKRIYRTLEKYLTQQIRLCDYPQFLHPLSCGSGLSSNLPLTLAEYAFYSEEDVKDYLSILPQIPDLLTQAFVWEEQQTASGYGMADFAIEDTIAQIETFLSSSKENLLLTTFEDRLEGVEGLSKDQKRSYLQNNKSLVNRTILPVFSNLKEKLNTLKENAPAGQGLSSFENGKDYYELLLASKTLSDRSLSTMITTLEQRLEELLGRIGEVIDSCPEAYSLFSENAFADSVSMTPEEMLLALKNAMEADYPALSDVTYQVLPIPNALKNDTTAAYYLIPPYDSPEENRIYYGDFSADPAELFMTLAHEGYPGHLYQQNYLLQHGLSPIFSLLDLTGYKEGWAFYTEIHAIDFYDFGVYETYHDALVELYRCNLEYGYCISSLTDLYVNGMGETREEIGRFCQTLGLEEATANAMYEYAIEEPGTYLSYYIGYLEIISIRQTAKQQAGKQFQLKEFHQAYLDLGPCYYEDLANYMKER